MSNIEALRAELKEAQSAYAAAYDAAEAARAAAEAVLSAARAAADDAWDKVRAIEKKIAKLEKDEDEQT